MNPEINNWLQLIFRWGHVVVGIIWIGHLYFFNWVNGPVPGKDGWPHEEDRQSRADAARAVLVPLGRGVDLDHRLPADRSHLLPGPRRLRRSERGNTWLWLAIVLVLLAVGFVVYNAIMKAMANKVVAAAICLVIFAAVYHFLEHFGKFSGRALYIHAGVTFGTIMALNVWMVIWPSQKRIITATKAGTPPDAKDVATAGLRSRHNTYMSVPLVFTMISNHYPTIYGMAPLQRDLILAILIAIGFVAVRMIYGKAAKVPGF